MSKSTQRGLVALLGAGKNIAARLHDIAEAGGAAISKRVHDDVPRRRSFASRVEAGFGKLPLEVREALVEWIGNSRESFRQALKMMN